MAIRNRQGVALGFRDLLKSKRVDGEIVIGAKNMERAIEWYTLVFNFTAEQYDGRSGEVSMGYGSNDRKIIPIVTLVAIRDGQSEAAVGRHPILFTHNLKKAQKNLLSKGLSSGPIQQDQGGNHFFEFQDSEGNKVEMCLEPGETLPD